MNMPSVGKEKAGKQGTGRGSWTGTLQVGLVTFPVQAFNVQVPEAEIHLHQLHAACDRRIHYQKVCPEHGEVDNADIVSAYDFSRRKYVRIEKEEFDKLRSDADRALTVETFIVARSIDAIYLDGRNYYLVPEKAAAEEPYGVLYRAMTEMDRWGIGQVLFSEREQVVLLRPYDDLLIMSMLRYQAEMRAAEELKVAIPRAGDKMVKLAETLIDGVSKEHFDLANYQDPYKARLKQLIDTKIEGKEITAPVAEKEESHFINLADALKQSIARSRGQEPKAPPKGRGHAAGHAPKHRRRAS